MSKKDRVKTMLDFLKAVIIALLSALFGVFGYAIINYESLDLVRGLGVGVAVLCLMVFLGVCLILFFKELDKLEEL
ncbi:hypothetical protein [Helicobacter canis]|uniref:Uncharacterized protein n=1 Tax=Helicobacter canis NCTC 12740 TaxID=1357399 RepID=V8CJP5_9HELI|nr:hypothetical protein [Helicobacter canis]ETD27317.1 hypothetical protein HMPREF2087_00229 [Helicobacter canis NCTC 12740]